MLRFVSNIVPLLEINKQTMTRIGLLSDTHSYWDDKYLKYFEECDEIWHAGDIGSVEVAERFAPVQSSCRIKNWCKQPIQRHHKSTPNLIPPEPCTKNQKKKTKNIQ